MTESTLELFDDFFNEFHYRYHLVRQVSLDWDFLCGEMSAIVTELEKNVIDPKAYPLLASLKKHIQQGQSKSDVHAERVLFLSTLFKSGLQLFEKVRR